MVSFGLPDAVVGAGMISRAFAFGAVDSGAVPSQVKPVT